MFDQLQFKKFMQPAMTYQDYYMTSSLKKLQCYRNLGLDEPGYEFQCAFNGTATKTVIIKQPLFMASHFLVESLQDNRTVEFELENKFSISLDQLSKFKIHLYLIAKKQNIIMNYIPEKKSLISAMKD